MASKQLPIVAIVGQANVGKSSLFNAILKRREAIVANEPGTTRDAVTAKASNKGKDFWLVDTAGMKDPEDNFEFTIQEQIIQAADSADVIWVVVEADIPITEEDRRVAKMALKSRKPVFLLINKVDKARGADLSALKSPPYDGLTGERETGRIGFASLRAGGIVGEHTVMFASEDEVLTLSHKAIDRSLFARGAVAAAAWVRSRSPGLYDMQDVLGFRQA